jgi:DNA-directed RNA polymerase specialized sigma24 family protein
MEKVRLMAMNTKLTIFVNRYNREKHIPEMEKEPDHTYSNEELIDGIIKGDNEIFRYVSDITIPYLTKTIGKNGTRSQAEEIVQDAYIVIFKKANSTGLQIKCKFLTYYIAVCKNIWFYSNRLKGKQILRNEELKEDISIDEEEIEMLWMESREFRLYRRYFNNLKEKQQAILASSLDGVPYKDLYRQYGFKSIDAYKNEVFRIKKKLFQKINQDTEFHLLKNHMYWSYDE